MSKNIVVCCDGTGNEVEGNLSNVLKLFRIAQKNAAQRLFYSPGIGTIGSADNWTKLKQNTKSVFELATGYGLDGEILTAYQFICRQFEADDSLFLFGFSRGAYTARALWLLIFGLLLSIPLLVFGGLLIVGLLRSHPGIVVLGGVVLGWIAGQIALADPVLADWAQRDAPALPVVLPLLGAVLVFWESRILLRARRRGKPFRAMKLAAAVAPRQVQATAMPSPTVATGRSE
jgi:Uncharacterized alpha/beta hydrolase domain (DUF2235)